MVEDRQGPVPIGEYLKTFIWTMKNGQTFIQVIKGSFDIKGEEIKFQQDMTRVDIKSLDNRKLIYPKSHFAVACACQTTRNKTKTN